MILIFKLLYRSYRSLSGLRYWLERRFTRAGWVVVGGLIAAMLLAPDTENTVAYQGLSLMLILLLGAICFSWFFKARFSAQRLLPRFGTVGAPLRYGIRLKNLSSKPQSGLALLEELSDPRPDFAEWLAVELAEQQASPSFRLSRKRASRQFQRARTTEEQVPTVMPGREVEARMELVPMRRGLLRLDGIVLARPDPLGLFRGFVRHPLPQSALILPKRYLLPPMALPGTMKYQQGGVALASSVGRSHEFVSLRDYRDGDPPRHIHWRSWAKVGKPVVKEFEDEFFVRHALVLDTFTGHPHSAAFEEAVSVAASFACTILTQESLLDLLFIGPQSYCFTAGRGLAHADQMLEVLASVQICPDKPFGALERLVLEHVSVVSGCICVLLDWDDERQEFVRKLKTLDLPVLVLLVTQPGRKDAFDPGPLRDEPQKFCVLECGRIEEGLAKLNFS
ncbi:MAG: DUF58 domain-containing protein [Verrucomicrobia bacterium]|nr:MAG: DUF58 domain-containing protein [Verrucomicrobiota bacterium]